MTYANPHLLVDTDWLEAHLGDAGLRVIDCRIDIVPAQGGGLRFVPATNAWKEEHIPGATFVDFNEDLSDRDHTLPFMLPSSQQFAEVMSQHGVGDGTRVVLYDGFIEAFDFVSFAAPMEHQAYIDRTTGKIYWVSEAVDDELPEDLDESDRYITIPHKNDLDLGNEPGVAVRGRSVARPICENRGVLSTPRRICPIQGTSRSTAPPGTMVRIRNEMHRGGSQAVV